MRVPILKLINILIPTLFVISVNNAAYQNSNVSKYSSQVLVLETFR